MEMNTRLQVEHTITEEVYNIDIVKEQINISSGNKLTYNQNDIKKIGHSVECRINAENPLTFLPSTVLIKTYHPPGGPGIRIDSALYAGCNISSFYDGLISKLISTGKTRQECIVRLKRALNEYVIEGVETNIPLLKEIISKDDFINGSFDINWMGKL
jgi:acetyl-CoA carboxylase biotin carboxylase subunit